MKSRFLIPVLIILIHTLGYGGIDINNFRPTGHVTDLGGFFDDNQEYDLNNYIWEIEKRTTVEIEVITIPSLEGQEIFDYSQYQFNRLGIGKKSSNNGLLLVFSKQDRKWRIHTGTGIEATFPDITCNNIGNNIIKPYFKSGDYYIGVQKGLEEINSILNKKQDDVKNFIEQETIPSATTKSDIDWANVFFYLIMIGLIGVIIYLIYKKLDDDYDKALDIYVDIKQQLSRFNSKKQKLEQFKDSTNIKVIDDSHNELVKIFSQYNGIYKNFYNNAPGFFDWAIQTDLIKNGHSKIEVLTNISDKFESIYTKWEKERARYDNINNGIKTLDPSSFNSSIENSKKYHNELKSKFGVTMNYNESDDRERLNKLVELRTRAIASYAESFDMAEKLLSDANTIGNSITSNTKSIKSVLDNHVTALSEIKDWEKILNNDRSDLRKYINYRRHQEEEEATNAIDRFTHLMTTFELSKILEYHSELKKTRNIINSVKVVWLQRKTEEEEKIRRQQEAEQRRLREIEAEIERARAAEAALIAAALSSSRRDDDSGRSSGFDFGSSNDSGSSGGGESSGGGADGGW